MIAGILTAIKKPFVCNHCFCNEDNKKMMVGILKSPFDGLINRRATSTLPISPSLLFLGIFEILKRCFAKKKPFASSSVTLAGGWRVLSGFGGL